MSAAPVDDCPLSPREQTRNLLIFALNKSLVYLGAPALYIGITQARLCKQLGAAPTLSNLSSTVYFWMTPLPILVAWYFCTVRVLRPVLAATYLTIAAAGVAVTATLVLRAPAWMVIAAVVAHAGIMGCALGVVAAFEWEVIGRGVSQARRGLALALAFGCGPVLAFLSSLASHYVLKGVAYPWNFAALFGVTIPLMVLAIFLASRFVIPKPAIEVQRQPFVAGVFGGIGDFFRDRLILVAAVATILISSGYNVFGNISLFTEEALGEQASQQTEETSEEKQEPYAGAQNALRFGFKTVAGLLLGWLLARTHPKAGLLVTGTLCLLSVGWALLVPGLWFLVTFGLMGAGELWGVYYPNYILSCSPKTKMRRNMAFVSMLYLPSGFAPLLFGYIAESVEARTGDEKLGFQVSFIVAGLFLVAALVLVLLRLPPRPQPAEPETERAPPAAS